MDLSALRQEILEGNDSASKKADLFLRKSKLNKLTTDEWRALVAGVPADVEEAIVEQMPADPADAPEQIKSKKLADRLLRIGTPSNYAINIERQAEIATGEIFNCYRSSQRPIPLALLYSFFDMFCWSASDTTDLQQRDMLFTLELCQKMQEFPGKESCREQDFGKLFREYLEGILPAIQIKHQTRGASIIDIQLQVQIAEEWVPLIYIEVKREAGHSGDAQQEGMAYHFQDVQNLGFKSNWQTLHPALLLTVLHHHALYAQDASAYAILNKSVVWLMAAVHIACAFADVHCLAKTAMQVVGPTVRVFGLCVDATSTGICEPLSPAMDMLLIPHIPDAAAKLARLFSAMPILVQELRTHYQAAAVETRKLMFLSTSRQQLPYPFWDCDMWTKADQLSNWSNKLVYVAQRPQQPLQLVKFTQQYGVEVHDAWAAAGIVPGLLAKPCKVAKSWQQVSMEYLAPKMPDSSG